MTTLRDRSFLRLLDFTPEELRLLLDRSHEVKAERRRGERPRRFEGCSLAMLFEKRSTRTRAAFETAFGEEGGHPVFLSSQDIQLGAKETVEDTARVLGRMFDLIEFRGFRQETVDQLARHADVPVINGLTDSWHPTQALADLMTMEEEFGRLRGLTTAFVGDGRNNVSNSLLVSAALMGLNHTIYCPEELRPDPEVLRVAETLAAGSGASLGVVSDPATMPASTEVVYTDVWVSMGEEAQAAERLSLLKPFQVNAAMLDRLPDAMFLHCLPAVRGNEMTAEVIDGKRSRVFDQAENRKHTIKAIMLELLGVD